MQSGSWLCRNKRTFLLFLWGLFTVNDQTLIKTATAWAGAALKSGSNTERVISSLPVLLFRFTRFCSDRYLYLSRKSIKNTAVALWAESTDTKKASALLKKDSILQTKMSYCVVKGTCCSKCSLLELWGWFPAMMLGYIIFKLMQKWGLLFRKGWFQREDFDKPTWSLDVT